MTLSTEQRDAFLHEMGIGPVWKNRIAGLSQPAVNENQVPADVPTRVDNVPGSDIAHMNWAELKAVVSGCTKCGLCQGRTQTVFGVGDTKARWLFVGEGPGRNEDLQGDPFVGPAGKLLDNMLLAMGLKRGENTYITNIVKCRPTGSDGRDRPPTEEETAACMPYLQRQIDMIQPSMIVAMGKTAALSLLGLDQSTSVGQLRGKVHAFSNTPLVVTYHPAYLLRQLEDKSKAWRDLCLAMETYAKRARTDS
jgi:uracil-DNA glycosylase family 4